MIPKTRYVILSIAFGMLAAGHTEKPFHAGAATDYSHQESEQVVIGAKPYNTEDLTVEAFGKKADLLRYQVLPVLVVIQNNRKRTVDLRNLEINLVGADGRHVQPVPPED
ncbi:MAG TPA: hypothetical protein VG168_00160, partial [Bryobacteraceae bacterium]|nr:hypothetical protein [Bryobacteraceae bacterium]